MRSALRASMRAIAGVDGLDRRQLTRADAERGLAGGQVRELVRVTHCDASPFRLMGVLRCPRRAACERAVGRQRDAQGQGRVCARSPRSGPRLAPASPRRLRPARPTDLRSTTSTRRIGPSAGCTRRRLAAWSTPPMLPPSAAGAALNGYSTTPRSQSTRRLLENGYESGCISPPSTIASPPLVLDDRVAVLRRAVRTAAQRTREHAARRAEHAPSSASKSCTIRSTQTPPERAGSIIQSFQPGGGESRCALAASGRPELARRDDPAQLDVLGPEAQHEADDEQLAGTLGRGHDRLRVLQRERDRLLEQHVLARRERTLGRLAVQRRRQADVDHVHVAALERRVEVVDGFRPAQVRRRARLAPACATRRPRTRARPASAAQAAGVGLAHEAAAEDRDVDHPRPSAFRCAQARFMHGVDLGERRPRLALELDLDRERAAVAAGLEDAGGRRRSRSCRRPGSGSPRPPCRRGGP